MTHDAMIETLLKVLIKYRQLGHNFEIVVENPVGSLAKRPFMQGVQGEACEECE